jgi:O-antigen ligase
LAVDRISPARQPSRLFGGVQWSIYHFFSLETLLVMFAFGSFLKLAIPSPPLFPETVFYGAASIAVGIWVILREGIYLRGVPIVVAGLVFSGWMLVSYAWSPSAVLARESLVYVLGINLWALFATACIVAGSRERTLRLLLLVALAGLILSAYGTYIDLVQGNFRFYRGPHGDWPVRVYLAWGSVVGPGTAVVLAAVIYTRLGSAMQLLGLGVLAVCLYFILFCGSRSALIGVAAALMATLFINLPRINNGRIEVPLVAVLGLFAIVSISGYIAYAVSIDQSIPVFNRLLRLLDQAQDPLLRGGANRFDYYVGAYRAWLESPIFGHGLLGFATYFCAREDPGCFPHNVFLQALTDFGMIGFVIYIIFLCTALRHFNFARLRDDRLMAMLLMVFVTIALYAMIHANLATDHRVFFFIGLLALRPPPPEADDDDEDQGVISQGAENTAPSAIHGAAQVPGRR